MIINGQSLLDLKPLEPMLDRKVKEHGVSAGLSEAGYDLRIKQDVWFKPNFDYWNVETERYEPEDVVFVDAAEREGFFAIDYAIKGRFTLASTIEKFNMPPNLVGIVHDKSSWARKGLSVFNTVIESGWNGFLTLELIYHGKEELHIPAGSGIAQVLFHEIKEPAIYNGKYNDQKDEPTEAIFE